MRDGWQVQPTNESTTVRGPQQTRSHVSYPLTSDPARDPSRADETTMASDMARHENCHEVGDHESVHVCVSREPSSPNERTNEPQVERTHGDRPLTGRGYFVQIVCVAQREEDRFLPRALLTQGIFQLVIGEVS